MKTVLKAWGCGAAVMIAGVAAGNVALLMLARRLPDDPVLAQVLLVHVPWFLALSLASGTAAYIHRQTNPSGRWVLAVFGIPAFVTLANLAVTAAGPRFDPATAMAFALIGAAGAVAGAVLGRRLTPTAFS